MTHKSAALSILCIASFAMVGFSAQETTKPQPEPPAATPAKAKVVLVVRITDGLDCAEAVRALGEAMHKAEHDGGAAVLVELTDFMPYRSDIVRDLIVTIKEARVPVDVRIAYTGTDRRASLGQIMVGIMARRFTVSHPLDVLSPAGVDRRELYAGRVKWDIIETDLRELLRPRLKARANAEAWTELLVSPRKAAWIRASEIATEHPELVFVDKPGPLPGRTVDAVTDASGSEGTGGILSARIPLRWLTAAGLVDGVVESRADVLKALGVDERHAEGIDVSGGAEAASTKVVAAFDAIKAQFKTSDAELAKVPEDHNKLSRETRTTIAKHVLAVSESVNKSVTEIEAIFEKYPEVLRLPAPGTTKVGSKASTYATKWRSLVKADKDKAAKSADKAKLIMPK